MGGEGEAPAALRHLPPPVVAELRRAFRAEVAERLPRLAATVHRAAAADLVDAVRDAHTLGSSAAVVGECEASRQARATEGALQAPVPDWEAARGSVRLLTAQLAPWST